MSATLDENKPRLNLDALLADLPPRVARIETHIEYMRGDIGELKTGLKELRAEVRSDFRWLIGILVGLFGLMLAGFGGLWAVIAKGLN